MTHIRCDEEVLHNLKGRVSEFLTLHPDVIVNPKWIIDTFLRNTARLGGRCPCDAKRPQCPCQQAYQEINGPNKKCNCGLFVKKE